MEKGVAIAGNIIADHIKQIESYPKQGMLCTIKAMSKGVGGCVPNTGVNLARLDSDVRVQAIGLVGDDELGDFVLDTLEDNNVDVSCVKVIPAGVTGFTDVMNAMDTNERTFFHARGVNAQFDIDDIDFDRINADIFHIGYALLLDRFDVFDEQYGTKLARTLKLASDHGLLTSMDVVSDLDPERYKKFVAPCLKYCDYIILNEIESGMVSGVEPRNENGRLDVSNIQFICRDFFDRGVKRRVVIHAPEGGFSMNADGRFICVPSLRLPEGYIKGTVGAGDAFCAGMLYSIYKELPEEQALRLASCAAASNLAGPDSISGAQSVEKAMALEIAFGRQEL